MCQPGAELSRLEGVPRKSHAKSHRLPRAAVVFFVALLAVVALTAGVLAWQPSPSESVASPTDTPTSSPTEPPVSTPSPEPTTEPDPPQPAVFTIGAVGDVLPHDTPIRVAHLDGDDYDFTPMLEATRQWSEGVDLAICNMEVPLSMPGEKPSGYPLFGAPPQIVANLAGLGWNGCSTGTNHTLDRGAKNAEYTLDTFDENSLGHHGSARSQREADSAQFYDLEREGQTIRVAQIGSTYGTNGLPIPQDKPWVVTLLDADLLIAQGEKARAEGADIVLATLHWGNEYQLQAAEVQIELATKLADSGAFDLIIGTHPHVPQEYAKLPGGPDGDGMWVAYSLGNFISNQDSNCCIPETSTGLFLTATVTKPAQGPARVTGMEWTPMTVDRLGNQRAYPLVDLLTQRPEGLTLTNEVLADRMARVEHIMAGSHGAEFTERTTPPTPTGPPAVVVPRTENGGEGD